jgi:hypothetical protein
MLLIFVKCLHSYAIIHLLVCLYVLWDYVLAGRHEDWIEFVVICILLEALVFALAGFTCPFTSWAIVLGDSTGTDYLSELLYLERINYVESYSVMAAIGLPLAAWRYYKSLTQRRRETEAQRV